MEQAISLIVGFVMGCGCTVALIFCLKPAAKKVFHSGQVQKQKERRQEAPVEQAKPEKLPIDKQFENFFSFDGTPQTGKDVNDDGD